MLKRKTSERSKTKREMCVVLDRQFKQDLKIQVRKEEKTTSEIIPETSKRYLNERREQEREERERKHEERRSKLEEEERKEK